MRLVMILLPSLPSSNVAGPHLDTRGLTLIRSTTCRGTIMIKTGSPRDSLNLVTATIELPGLRPEDVTITFLLDRLTISGEAVTPPPQGEGTYTTRELPHGKFSRKLKVPLGLKPEDFNARMENGLLTVTYPRDPPPQAPQRIPVE